LTLTDINQISGEEGRFTVNLTKKARFIDMDKCTGCGDCAEVCPIGMVDEFNQGLNDRKATFKPYAQAFPGAYTISKLDTAPCTVTCPANVTSTPAGMCH